MDCSGNRKVQNIKFCSLIFLLSLGCLPHIQLILLLPSRPCQLSHRDLIDVTQLSLLVFSQLLELDTTNCRAELRGFITILEFLASSYPGTTVRTGSHCHTDIHTDRVRLSYRHTDRVRQSKGPATAKLTNTGFK